MLQLSDIHHIAIICSDYARSKTFYCSVLGFTLQHEEYRVSRESWRAELSLHGIYRIELFSFPEPPSRSSYPEACGLRHLALRVVNIDVAISTLQKEAIECEPIRIDEHSGCRFTFFADPDGLPIELYEDLP